MKVVLQIGGSLVAVEPVEKSEGGRVDQRFSDWTLVAPWEQTSSRESCHGYMTGWDHRHSVMHLH